MGRITFTKPQLSKSPKPGMVAKPTPMGLKAGPSTVKTSPKPTGPGITQAANGNYGVAGTNPSNPGVKIQKPEINVIKPHVQPGQPKNVKTGGGLLGAVKGTPGKVPSAKRLGSIR